MQAYHSFHSRVRRHLLASFPTFGYLTIDLAQLLSSNAPFLVRHGWR